MQICLKNALECLPVLESLKNNKLPLKTVYKLSRLAKEVQQHEEFYRNQIMRIISECAVLKENGEPVLTEDQTSFCVVPGKEQECHQRIVELETLEITLSECQIPLEEFGNLELTFAEMEKLYPFIKE